MIEMTGNVYETLIRLPQVPPETGGILAGCNGLISEAYLQSGTEKRDGEFQPDENELLPVLDQWIEQGFDLIGIFHTHAPNWPDLSGEDRNYLEAFWKLNRESGLTFCFPLVFPESHIRLFSMKEEEGKIETFELPFLVRPDFQEES